MNNKGFTLVELLAIIIILGIIVVIAVPSMTNQIEKGETNQQNILNEKIENASKIYLSKYYVEDLINGNQINFTLKELQEDGLINFKNDQCNSVINKNIEIKIEEKDIIYNYKNLESNNCYKCNNDNCTNKKN